MFAAQEVTHNSTANNESASVSRRVEHDPCSRLCALGCLGVSSLCRRCHSAWQPDPGRGSTYRCVKSVQTTGTTSRFRGTFHSFDPVGFAIFATSSNPHEDAVEGADLIRYIESSTKEEKLEQTG